MTLAVRAVFWVIAYVGAVLSPLVFAAVGASHPRPSAPNALRFSAQRGRNERAVRRLASLVAWFALLWAFWVALVGTTQALEVIAGACAAAVGVAFVEVLRSRGLLAYAADPRLALKAWRLMWLVPADFGLATWALVVAIARGQRVRGEWVRAPFPVETGERGRWQRAFAVAASNGAVNGIVVDLDGRQATMHVLNSRVRSGRTVL